MSPHDRQLALARLREHGNQGAAMMAELAGTPLEASATGTRVRDETGVEYLDCGGYGVFLLGHCHPAVVGAVREQVGRLPLSTRGLVSGELAAASEALAAVAPAGLDRVYFASSGAEATETSLKLARLQGRHRLLATEGGYHGKTLGALSVTGREAYRTPFAPLLPDVAFVPFGDLEGLAAVLAKHGPETAFIVEPVQAEGGVRIPPTGYLAEVERLCREFDAFLILDEIQTGLGRLGQWWGRDEEGVNPDVLLVGKALSGGVVPVSAVVAGDEAFGLLARDPALHSSTFSGAPIAAAAASAALAVIAEEHLVSRARALGERLLPAVREVLGPACGSLVEEVRGQGALIGIEMKSAPVAADFALELRVGRVLVSHSLNAQEVVRLTPPALFDSVDEEMLLAALVGAGERIAVRWSAELMEAS
jgi:putrescine aminotransferase